MIDDFLFILNNDTITCNNTETMNSLMQPWCYALRFENISTNPIFNNKEDVEKFYNYTNYKYYMSIFKVALLQNPLTNTI